jgi:hypothetical protein
MLPGGLRIYSAGCSGFMKRLEFFVGVGFFQGRMNSHPFFNRTHFLKELFLLPEKNLRGAFKYPPAKSARYKKSDRNPTIKKPLAMLKPSYPIRPVYPGKYTERETLHEQATVPGR